MALSILSRRSFLYQTAAVTSSITLPISTLGQEENSLPLQFGLIADVHQDIMHDAKERVEAFVSAMENEKPDFICQLGDFCIPHERNQEFYAAFQTFSGPKYHVIGNHDMDGGFSREHAVAYFGMPHKYYSFDTGGIHFIVLDGNDPGGSRPGYACHIGEEQTSWLQQDLKNTDLPCIIFSHQPLDDTYGGIESSAVVQAILEDENQSAKPNKIMACFSGHLHRDYIRLINGIYYVQINSASYHWLGGDYKHLSYDENIHKDFPYIEYTAPYQKPLWATVKINTDKGVMEITGKESQWVGPSPNELQVKQNGMHTITPAISNWRIPVL